VIHVEEVFLAFGADVVVGLGFGFAFTFFE
jgi:hypothetical protein